jgi:hypothetical protein
MPRRKLKCNPGGTSDLYFPKRSTRRSRFGIWYNRRSRSRWRIERLRRTTTKPSPPVVRQASFRPTVPDLANYGTTVEPRFFVVPILICWAIFLVRHSAANLARANLLPLICNGLCGTIGEQPVGCELFFVFRDLNRKNCPSRFDCLRSYPAHFVCLVPARCRIEVSQPYLGHTVGLHCYWRAIDLSAFSRNIIRNLLPDKPFLPLAFRGQPMKRSAFPTPPAMRSTRDAES